MALLFLVLALALVLDFLVLVKKIEYAYECECEYEKKMQSTLSKLLSWLGLERSIGSRGERVAVRHLRKQSYRVLARNLRNRFGEIDLLAEAPDRRTIVLIEVKTSGSDTTLVGPRPEERVNHVKQRKLMALAAQAARQYGLTERPIRFDVVGVDLPPHGRPCVRHHVGAFEAVY